MLAFLLMASFSLAWGQTTQDTTFDWLSGLDNYAKNRYAIGIPFSTENLIQLRKRRSIYRYRLLYISVQDLENPDSGMMYIGFFENEKEALGLKRDSRFLFPNQSVKFISQEEHRKIISVLKKHDSENPPYLTFAIGPDAKNLFDNESKEILNSAKTAYVNHQYKTAIAQYRLLAALAEDAEMSAWATELIGLCQEKLKQFSAAIKTYESILENHSEYSGLARVQQRHRGLTTASWDEQSRLRKAKESDSNREIFNRGVFGQSYRTLSRQIDDQESEEYSRLVSTDMDLRSSVRWRNHTLKTRINGYRIDDQLNKEDSKTNIKRFFIDYQHLPSGSNLTLGRIKDHNNGVFTSYDGLSLSYPVLKDMRVGFSTGAPVYFADIYEELDYFFYSAYADWDINKRWHLNSYITHQTLNDVTDRQGLGLNAQYFDSNLSSSLHMDYDFAFNEMNSLLWTSSYIFLKKSKFSATYANQKSPFLSATNILIGQPDLDLDLYLRSEENRNALLENALERTSSSEYYVLTLNHQFTSKSEVSLDYTHSTLSDVPNFERLLGVSVVTDKDLSMSYDSYNGQIVLQEFLSKQDAATMGIRSSSSDSIDSLHVYLRERIRIGRTLDIQPKLSYTQSTVTRTNADQHVFRYALSLTYKPWRAMALSLETGGENIDTGVENGTYSQTYGLLSYRLNF